MHNRARGCWTFVLFLFTFANVAANAEPVGIESSKLSLRFELNPRGISIVSLRNKATNVEHLSRPSPMFELAVDGMVVQSSTGVAVDRFSYSGNRTLLTIEAHVVELPLKLTVEVALGATDSVAKIRVGVTNLSNAKVSLKTVLPSISGLVTAGDASGRVGMVPTEIGTVAPLENTAPPIPLRPPGHPPLGMRYIPQIGLPDAMNSMEVASIYDAGGTGGVFFADLDGDLDNGISPIQFSLSSLGVNGYWITDLDGGQTKNAPRFAIGVQDAGDWHTAVDYYTAAHRPRWHFPETPAWLRDQGAIYGYSGGGAGGIYLMYPGQDLKQRIASFHELPKLLKEAKTLGTNVVYIWGFWNGDPSARGGQYSNKGDYVPRDDLGGADAFVDGIRELHKQGGKLIVYVEAFIIQNQSRIGREKGPAWGGRDPAGEFHAQYRNNYSMPSYYKPWQDYLVSVCERLVRDYGVDGIFLDSWAWRMNLPMRTQEEGGKLHTPFEYSQGVLTVADRVRNAIQAIKPDAVVIGETTAGPISRHWDGGLSADFAWMANINQQKILGSPVRYGVPEVNFMSNGRNLNEFNQIFAAGHNLALCDAQLPWVSYIRPLIEIRQRYKDALIHGMQSYQPATGDRDVVAYYYEGSEHRMVTAVNTSSQRHYAGVLALQPGEAGSEWLDLITGETLRAAGGKLALKIPPDGLRVLLRR